ncbi:STAS domain-containing protein [bacterium]|nr:STAS domain-containing protein [bacterium]
MQIEQETAGDVLVLRVLEKQVTSHEAPELKTALLGAMAGDEGRILLDLKAVENMDSTGLGALLFGLRQADQHDKDLRFSGMQKKVRFLVHVAQLDSTVPSYEDVEQGLRAFREDEGE